MEHFVRSLEQNRNFQPSWDTSELRTRIQKIMDMSGDSGTIARTSLLGGLDTQQLLMLHKKQFCFENLFYCPCSRLHLQSNCNEVLFVSTFDSYSGKMKYAVLPRAVWEQFRSIESPEEAISKANLELSGIQLQLDLLPSVFKLVHIESALEVLSNSFDVEVSMHDRGHHGIVSLLARYERAWEIHGLILAFDNGEEDLYDDSMTA